MKLKGINLPVEVWERLNKYKHSCELGSMQEAISDMLDICSDPTECYAVVQIGHAVIGVGRSRAECLRDAAEWVDDPADLDDIESQYTGVDGDTVLLPCSPELYMFVMRAGGTIVPEITNGMACLPGPSD